MKQKPHDANRQREEGRMTRRFNGGKEKGGGGDTWKLACARGGERFQNIANA